MLILRDLLTFRQIAIFFVFVNVKNISLFYHRNKYLFINITNAQCSHQLIAIMMILVFYENAVLKLQDKFCLDYHKCSVYINEELSVKLSSS